MMIAKTNLEETKLERTKREDEEEERGEVAVK